MQSITTDFVQDKGNPQPFLREIADAGFSHVHWCHHWGSDFLYSESEIIQIGRWLKDYGLKLLDLHASAGIEKNWGSPLEYERLAGVELINNRIAMAATLGSDVIVLHVAHIPHKQFAEPAMAAMHRSLDEIAPFATRHGVRIALENMANDWFEYIDPLLRDYPSTLLGICYDSGHGNIGGRGLDFLQSRRQRLLALHLHDNDGQTDEHKIIFTGTVDWQRLATIIADSSYTKGVSSESCIHNTKLTSESEFLALALAAGQKLQRMIDTSIK